MEASAVCLVGSGVESDRNLGFALYLLVLEDLGGNAVGGLRV